ncbi:MAG TPA: DUF4238 domain-containing protein [Gemmatimonadaceae bacterium]|nr:DUF4238 domain-containing protein [Gemmatimonadaceae bacterium]
MAKGRDYKDQHFVPSSYTAAWCDPDTPEKMTPYVWVFPARSRDGRRKAPDNIFSETDFYTVIESDGTRNVQIENSLSALESRFAVIRRKLARQEEISSVKEHLDLLTFVAAMSARTRAQRDHHQKQFGKVKRLMDSMIDQYERSTPEQRRALLSHPANQVSEDCEPAGSYDDVVAMVENPMRFTLGATIEAMLPILLKMNLAVIETDDPIGFVTSDDPCVLIDREAHKVPPFFRGNPGLLKPTVELSLPLSPSQMMIFSWVQGMQGYLKTDQRGVDELNRRTIAWAHEEYVVSRNETRDAWFEVRPEPEDSWEKERARKKASGVVAEALADKEASDVVDDKADD